MQNLSQAKQAKWLMCLGLILFMLGLLVGLFIPIFKNSRMGLSAHLEGTLNGIFMLILGVIWNKLLFIDRLVKLAFYLVIYSSFANFFAVTIGAITGAGRMMPIAGGKDANNIIEWVISFLLVSLSISLICACSIILIGLLKYLKKT